MISGLEHAVNQGASPEPGVHEPFVNRLRPDVRRTSNTRRVKKPRRKKASSQPDPIRLLAILEATPDLVALTDLEDHRFFYLNEAGRKMLGLDPSENLSELHLTDFVREAAWELIRNDGIPTALRNGVWIGETAFQSRAGREIAVSHLLVAQRNPDGHSGCLSTIARDITESKRALEALRRSEEMFRIMTENASELIALVDMQGRRLYNSPSYQKVLGYSPEELQRTWSLQQIHPDDLEKLADAAREAKTTGVGKFVEYRMRHKDGSWRTLESHAGVIRNSQGEIENLLIVARDITARKKAEKEREMMEIQLRHAQKLESIGQLAAGIAHEINTPTQYIGDNLRFLQEAFADLKELFVQYGKLVEGAKANTMNPATLLEAEAAAKKADLEYLAAEIPKALQQSLEGVDRVAKIVQAMKQFSHPGSEDRMAVDLNKAIESTVTVTHNEWKFVANLVTDMDPALPVVQCFPGEFNQVILNLIVNAAHAIADKMGEGSQGKGTITVSTRHCGEWVEIRISDTGTGIPEKARGRVFEPFFTTKPVGKGTGQGLAIAHSVIVDKHGGRIDFETETGVGTTFVIRLPVSAPAGVEEKKLP